MIGEDIVEAVANAPKPALIYAHPASGTKWLQQQLTARLGCDPKDVAHESIGSRHPSELQAVISFRYWKLRTMEKFASNFALTRDPLKVLRSSIPLFKNQTIKSSILMEMYADSTPRGDAWLKLQEVDYRILPFYTLMRWYERAETSMPKLEQWFRIEDASTVVEAPANAKAHRAGVKEITWDEVCTVGGRTMVKLLEYAKTHGYDISKRELGGVIGCSSIQFWK